MWISQIEPHPIAEKRGQAQPAPSFSLSKKTTGTAAVVVILKHIRSFDNFLG